MAKSDLGANILRSFRVKSDGESDNPKTLDYDVTALRKLLDNLIDAYSKETNKRRSNTDYQVLKKYLDVSIIIFFYFGKFIKF